MYTTIQRKLMTWTIWQKYNRLGIWGDEKKLKLVQSHVQRLSLENSAAVIRRFCFCFDLSLDENIRQVEHSRISWTKKLIREYSNFVLDLHSNTPINQKAGFAQQQVLDINQMRQILIIRM